MVSSFRCILKINDGETMDFFIVAIKNSKAPRRGAIYSARGVFLSIECLCVARICNFYRSLLVRNCFAFLSYNMWGGGYRHVDKHRNMSGWWALGARGQICCGVFAGILCWAMCYPWVRLNRVQVGQ